jgi:hypothetical protein
MLLLALAVPLLCTIPVQSLPMQALALDGMSPVVYD